MARAALLVAGLVQRCEDFRAEFARFIYHSVDHVRCRTLKAWQIVITGQVQNFVDDETGVIDMIIPEPTGGAHRDKDAAMAAVGKAIGDMLNSLKGKSGDKLLADRRRKYLDMGAHGLAA